MKNQLKCTLIAITSAAISGFVVWHYRESFVKDMREQYEDELSNERKNTYEARKDLLKKIASSEVLARTSPSEQERMLKEIIAEHKIDADNRIRSNANSSRMEIAKRTRASVGLINSLVFDIQVKLSRYPDADPINRDILTAVHEGLSKFDDQERSKLWCHLYRGDVESALGNYDNATRDYRQAHEIARRMIADGDQAAQVQRDLAMTHWKLGDLATKLHDFKESRNQHGQSLRIFRDLNAMISPSKDGKRELVYALVRLGDAELQIGDVREARGRYEEALKCLPPYDAIMPDDLDTLCALAIVNDKIGDAIVAQSDRDFPMKEGPSAVEKYMIAADQARLKISSTNYYLRSLAIHKQISNKNSVNYHLQHLLANSYAKMGDLRVSLGQSVFALEQYTEMLKIADIWAARYPQHHQAQRELAVGLAKLGQLSVDLGNFPDAANYFARSFEIVEKWSNLWKDDVESQRDLLVFGFFPQYRLNFAMKKYDLAISWASDAIKVAKSSSQALSLTNEIAFLEKQIEIAIRHRTPTVRRESAPPPRTATAR